MSKSIAGMTSRVAGRSGRGELGWMGDPIAVSNSGAGSTGSTDSAVGEGMELVGWGDGASVVGPWTGWGAGIASATGASDVTTTFGIGVGDG